MGHIAFQLNSGGPSIMGNCQGRWLVNSGYIPLNDVYNLGWILSTWCFTETIGGAIHWAGPELFYIHEDGSTPALTATCDIYMYLYGSVVLHVHICDNQLHFHFNHWYLGTFELSAILLHKIGQSNYHGASQWHSTMTTRWVMDNRDSLALYPAVLDSWWHWTSQNCRHIPVCWGTVSIVINWIRGTQWDYEE